MGRGGGQGSALRLMGTQLTPLGPEGLGLGQSHLPATLSPSCLHPLLQAGVGGRVGPRVPQSPAKQRLPCLPQDQVLDTRETPSEGVLSLSELLALLCVPGPSHCPLYLGTAKPPNQSSLTILHSAARVTSVNTKQTPAHWRELIAKPLFYSTPIATSHRLAHVLAF